MATNRPSASISRVSPVTVSAQPHALHRAVVGAEHLGDGGVGDEVDVLLRLRAVGHDRRGPELLAAVHQGHLRGELGQEGGLLHRRVAAADDDDVLGPEEGRVTDGAVADAAALQRHLGLEAELAGGGAGGDDHGPGAELVVADVHAQRLRREVDPGDVVGHELGAEALRLGAHRLHQLGAEDAVAEAGIVLDVGGDHQLAAVGEALEHQGLEVGARGVQGGRVAGRPAADDDDLTDVACHVAPSPSFGGSRPSSRLTTRDAERFLAALAPAAAVGHAVAEERSQRLPAERAEARLEGVGGRAGHDSASHAPARTAASVRASTSADAAIRARRPRTAACPASRTTIATSSALLQVDHAGVRRGRGLVPGERDPARGEGGQRRAAGDRQALARPPHGRAHLLRRQQPPQRRHQHEQRHLHPQPGSAAPTRCTKRTSVHVHMSGQYRRSPRCGAVAIMRQDGQGQERAHQPAPGTAARHRCRHRARVEASATAACPRGRGS